MRVIVFMLAVLISGFAIAQNGTIRGKVFDDLYGEPIVDAKIQVENSEITTSTDLDGAFSINLGEGTYNLIVSAEGYQEITYSDVEVDSDEVTVIEEIFIAEDFFADQEVELTGVVVSAETEKNTEEALIRAKKKSAVIFDGISAAKMKLTGDGNAVESAKRITGVTVEEGKYVYVRGLGDRYSKTTLNNVDIPGLDPDRNTLQMDIFPTSLLNNIVVNKNFSAELPADFTGGLVNIETLSFPNKKFLEVSVGFGFNPQMNLTNDYLSYDGGKTDFLGFDDGSRDLPSLAKSDPFNHPHPFRGNYTDAEVNQFVRSFSPELAAQNQTSLLNSSLSVAYGDQINFENGNDLGFFLSANLKNDYILYDDVTYADYQVDQSDTSNGELIPANVIRGQQGEYHALMGLLGGLAYKTAYSKYELTAMHLQSGQSKSGRFTIDNNDNAEGQSGYMALSDNLEYYERSLSNLLIAGQHRFTESDWNIDWRISPTLSVANDPDIRKTAFSRQTEEQNFRFSPGEAGLPLRIWRELDEWSLAGKLDLEKEYTLFNRDAKLKFGGASTYKSRNFDTFSFELSFNNINNQVWDGTDANQVLNPNNIYPSNTNGVYYEGAENRFPRRNSYEGRSFLAGGYISNEFQLFDNFKTILGLRVEHFRAYHTGGVTGNEFTLDDEEVLNSTDLFPSVNLIYNLNDMNFRAVYSRTVARPSFKELSFVQIVDPITNRIFNGGLFPYPDWDGNLQESYINNFDLRWEYFLGRGELISLSGFYKTFDQPIELVRIPFAATSTEFQPRNVGDGTVYGAELEVVKNLGFLSSFFEDFSISTNLTVLHSEIDMTDTEFNQREDFLRDGQSLDRTRDMVGQSPYTLNAGLIYQNQDAGLETGLFYNVKGSTLFLVTNGLYPDVYQEPFHDMNFSISKAFGKKRNLHIDFQVSNILNDTRDKVFEAFNAQNQLFERLNPNRTFSLTFGWDIF